MSRIPSYSAEPGPDERRLAIASQNIPTTTPSGTLIQHGSGIDIALYNQQDTARHATYGRGVPIAGEVSLSTTHGATSVKIALEGKVESTSSRSTRLHAQIIHMSSTLWEGGGSDVCPSILPFSFAMPETFVDTESGSTYPLPPSYDSVFAIQDMQVRCAYQISVVVVRSRWAPNKSMSVDIKYFPRTLPTQAIAGTSIPSFDSVKLAPDEWYRMSVVLEPKAHSTLQAVGCELSIPSTRVFAMRDTVPFFLRLHCPSSSMLALYGSNDPDEGWAHRLLHIAQHANLAPRIAVTIKRQVVTGAKSSACTARSYIIGTGSVRAAPPDYIASGSEDSDVPVATGYEGEIQFIPSLSTSSFDIGKLRVSDCIVLSIEPQGSARNHFDSLSHSEDVRIVTG